jgi:hypothetical protein
MVAAHVGSHPMNEDEMARLAVGDADVLGSTPVPRPAHPPIVAYGSTVLAALVAHDTLVLVQLGDGDIIWVGRDGTTSRAFERDERLVGSVTTSLCQVSAEAEVRVRVLSLTAPDAPVLICLSSDGYANSFRTDEDFLRVGSDVLAHIETRGLAPLVGDLPAFLDDASKRGSGDDITLALLTCVADGVAAAVPPEPKLEPKIVEQAPPIAAPRHIAAAVAGPVPAAVIAKAATPAPAAREQSLPLRSNPIAIGLGVVIIVVAAALFAASIPCARMPLVRPMCEARHKPADTTKGKPNEKAAPSAEKGGSDKRAGKGNKSR